MGMARSVMDDWPKNKLKKEIEMSGDPWIHRSDRMRCSTCMWFVEKFSGDGGEQPTVGRCRRHAPTMSGYPVVFMGDWCGDHKLDENKA